MCLSLSLTDFINNRGLLRRALHSDCLRKTRVDMTIRSLDPLWTTGKNSGWHPNRKDIKVLKDRLYYNASLEMLRKGRHTRVKK